MALTAISSSVFNATRTSTDDLTTVVETTALAASAASSSATLSYTYTSASPASGSLTFDLRALTDDRGTLAFTAISGIILKVRSGTVVTVDASALSAGDFAGQPAGLGSPLTLASGDYYCVASATPFSTVSGTSYNLAYTLTSAEVDLYVWGEGSVS
jgi:hypothetical protein